MEESGCHAEAEYNREASGGRLIGAILHVVVAIAALVLLLITALTLVVAKVFLGVQPNIQLEHQITSLRKGPENIGEEKW